MEVQQCTALASTYQTTRSHNPQDHNNNFFTAVKISYSSWRLLCSRLWHHILLDTHQCFGGTCCLCLQGRRLGESSLVFFMLRVSNLQTLRGATSPYRNSTLCQLRFSQPWIWKSLSSTMTMEVTSSSEMLVPIYEIIRGDIPEDGNLNSKPRKNSMLNLSTRFSVSFCGFP
jgi:hypothetical protein